MHHAKSTVLWYLTNIYRQVTQTTMNIKIVYHPKNFFCVSFQLPSSLSPDNRQKVFCLLKINMPEAEL